MPFEEVEKIAAVANENEIDVATFVQQSGMETEIAYSFPIEWIMSAARDRLIDGQRTTSYIYDVSGNLIYTIDPEGYVIEKRYDNNRQEIVEIRHSEKISISYEQLTESVISTLLEKNANDQIYN